MLAVLDGVPSLPESVDEWLDALEGPTAIRVPGRNRSRVRVVSGLLHGNEPSGLRAIFHALRSGEKFATHALFLIGAVEAARTAPRFSHRMLPGRRDLNRCFRAPFDADEGRVAEQMLELANVRPLEAVVDLHNNSGHNPCYGVGVTADASHLGLTSIFTDRYVCSSFGIGALMEAFPPRVPVVTIECGRAGDRRADETAKAGLMSFLRMDKLPTLEPGDPRMKVLRDPVRVRVRAGVDLHFGDHRESDADFTMDEDVDRHNFQRLEAGTRVGWVRPGAPWPVEVKTPDGGEISREIFALADNELRLKSPCVPIMLTTNATIARDDCLFYAVIERGT